LRFKITPLPPEEVPHYVEHRWTRAGGEGRPPFSDEALEMIMQHSQGIPRLINAICGNALLAAFAAGSHLVGAANVEAVAENLDLSDEVAGEPKISEIQPNQVAAGESGEMPNLDRDSAKKTEGKHWFSNAR
jgi:hypothetical protein